MKSSTPAQRVAILVDVQNMFYSAYDCFRGRLNYKELLDTASEGRQVVRTIAYAMRDGNNQSSFFTMLREVGYELKTKEPRVRPDGSRKGGWDIGIAIDALTLAPKVDVVVLVSGDGDFLDLVGGLQARGVRVELFAFERNVGRELREAADEFFAIGEELIFRDSGDEPEPEEEKAERPAPKKPEPKKPEPKKPEPKKPESPTPAQEEKPEPKRRSSSSFGAGLLDNGDIDQDLDEDEHEDEDEGDAYDDIEEVE
jgi:uncharacterized LabA/DUF88 family protein